MTLFARAGQGAQVEVSPLSKPSSKISVSLASNLVIENF